MCAMKENLVKVQSLNERGAAQENAHQMLHHPSHLQLNREENELKYEVNEPR